MNPSKAPQADELFWLAPFICVGLLVLALLRPWPTFPIPRQGRTVVDADGIAVPVETPFRGTALAWGTQIDGYLHDTHAPETLASVENGDRTYFSRQVISWIYPQILRKDDLWNRRGISSGKGPNAAIEPLLAGDPGAYLGGGGAFGPIPLMRRVGLPSLSLSRLGQNMDEAFFTAARVETALTGQPERGEALIAGYRQAVAQLERDLRPKSLANRPRVLMMASWAGDPARLDVRTSGNPIHIFFPRAGIENASDGFAGARVDAERILVMEPDIVFLMQGPVHHAETPQDFRQDPRWRGLKAVRANRVYMMPGSYPAYIGDMQFRPLWARWMAEVAHPEHMPPKLRQMLREHFLQEFAYRLSDEQIDAQLHIDENGGSAGYERFSRRYGAVPAQGAAP